jgi:CO/xanthine dehydrogenase Mo-binding subunit
MMPEDLGAPKGHRIYQQLLQSDKARFVGDRIAFVVAETLAQARDAADMVEVDYEPLPAVALLEDAAKDGAPKVWDDNPNGNVAFQLRCRPNRDNWRLEPPRQDRPAREQNKRIGARPSLDSSHNPPTAHYFTTIEEIF